MITSRIYHSTYEENVRGKLEQIIEIHITNYVILRHNHNKVYISRIVCTIVRVRISIRKHKRTEGANEII